MDPCSRRNLPVQLAGGFCSLVLLAAAFVTFSLYQELSYIGSELDDGMQEFKVPPLVKSSPINCPQTLTDRSWNDLVHIRPKRESIDDDEEAAASEVAEPARQKHEAYGGSSATGSKCRRL